MTSAGARVALESFDRLQCGEIENLDADGSAGGGLRLKGDGFAVGRNIDAAAGEDGIGESGNRASIHGNALRGEF